jgi:signal transduction histidine kinase
MSLTKFNRFYAAGLVMWAAICFSVTFGASSFAAIDGNIAVIRPISGLAVAILLSYGLNYWPSIFIGVVASGLLHGDSSSISLLSATGDVAGGIIGTKLLLSNEKFDCEFSSANDFFVLLFLAGFVGGGVNSIVDTLGIMLSGDASLLIFVRSWMANLLGVAVLAPFVMVWRKFPRNWLQHWRGIDVIVILGLAFLTGQAVFLDWMNDSVGQIARGYWMFLFVAWAGIRLGAHGVVTIIVAVAIQGLWGAHLGVGFFDNDIVRTSLANYWNYTFVLSVVGMALALHIGEIKKAEQALNEQKLAIERSNEELAAFAYIASHDLREPLRNIVSFATLLERRVKDKLDKDETEFLGFITGGAARMNQLILDLLDFSRVGRQNPELLEV